MKKHIIKLLGLQNLWVDSMDVFDSKVVVKVRGPAKSALCPHCTCKTKRVHQYKQRTIIHSVWQDRKVLLHFSQRRFYCKNCGKVFTEFIPGIDKKRSTKNYRNILIKKMSHSSLTHTINTTGASASTLYSVLREKYADNLIDWNIQGDNITLGIDEHSFRGKKMALTITNISQKKLLKILPSDSQATLKNFLSSIDKEKIKEICIDMRRGFKSAVQQELPDVLITADKFHVIAYANKMLDEVRSIVVGKHFQVRKILFKKQERLNQRQKEKLEMIFEKFKQFPSLYQAYFIKEKVIDFYQAKTKKQAKEKLEKIIMFCEESQSRYIKDYGRTLISWKENILNYFFRHSTNAFTEGVHTKIKMIKRISFGFRNVNNYIAKVSLAFIPLLWFYHHTF